tara:strand:+ start:114 stop:350 length:237 start_codon:yes stop_codon:yes gene_type:complete
MGKLITASSIKREQNINNQLTEKEFDDLYYLVWTKISLIKFIIKCEKESEKPNKKRILQQKVDLKHFEMIKRKISNLY